MKNLIFILFFSITSCINKNEIFAQNKVIENDTIKPKFLGKNSICYSKSLNFRKRYDLIISDFYEISEEQLFDINGDLKNDTIVILSPLNLTPGTDCELNSDELFDSRILIVFMSNGENFLFENLITNELGIGTLGSEFIKQSKNGFILEKENGQSCFFKYEIHIEYTNYKFTIQKIILSTGGCPYEKTKSKEFDYSNMNYLLEKYNRREIDSLRKAAKMD